MCLIFLGWRTHPDYPLVVAANRDEFHARPTAAAQYWEEAPHLLAGRDLEGGGTWLGVTRTGRFAALTNYRSARVQRTDAPSRGRLVSDFLLSRTGPRAYVDALQARAADYNGFNLLVADEGRLHWYSNRGGDARELAAGVYGISNDLLDTPWPKVERGKRRFEEVTGAATIDVSALFDLLMDRQIAEDAALPDTGIGLERERVLSPIFITAGAYGTRSSTVLLIGADGDVEFHERSHAPGSDAPGALTYAFRIESEGAPVY